MQLDHSVIFFMIYAVFISKKIESLVCKLRPTEIAFTSPVPATLRE